MITKFEELSMGQLAQVFNAITGQTVSKFMDKATARKRVAKAMETHKTALPEALAIAGLADPVEALQAEPVAVDPVAPTDPPAEKVEGVDYTLREDRWGFRHREQNGERAKAEPVKREGGKNAIVVQLLTKGGGTTIADLQAATGWLPHTTRAYLSRLGKTMAIKSEKIERDGTKLRVYSAAE